MYFAAQSMEKNKNKNESNETTMTCEGAIRNNGIREKKSFSFFFLFSTKQNDKVVRSDDYFVKKRQG